MRRRARPERVTHTRRDATSPPQRTHARTRTLFVVWCKNSLQEIAYLRANMSSGGTRACTRPPGCGVVGGTGGGVRARVERNERWELRNIRNETRGHRTGAGARIDRPGLIARLREIRSMLPRPPPANFASRCVFAKGWRRTLCGVRGSAGRARLAAPGDWLGGRRTS